MSSQDRGARRSAVAGRPVVIEAGGVDQIVSVREFCEPLGSRRSHCAEGELLHSRVARHEAKSVAFQKCSSSWFKMTIKIFESGAVVID